MNYPELERLIEIVSILRSENGCQWDREQTHKSLRSNMIEEAYEAVDAIDGEHNAIFDIRNQKVFVKRGLEPDVFFRDVSVELAHVEFAADNYGYNRSENEYKAKIAAYMLCKRYGIDANGIDIELPESYQEMKYKEVRSELNTVRKAMNEINGRMNEAIEKQRKEKTEQER